MLHYSNVHLQYAAHIVSIHFGTRMRIPSNQIYTKLTLPRTCLTRMDHLQSTSDALHACFAQTCRCCCRTVQDVLFASKTLSSLPHCAILYPPQRHLETDHRPQKSCQHLLQWAVLAACYAAPLQLWEPCEQQEALAPLRTCAACHNRIKWPCSSLKSANKLHSTLSTQHACCVCVYL